MKKRFYYADGEKMELIPSQSMVAVRFKEDADEKKCSDLIDGHDSLKDMSDVEVVEPLNFAIIPLNEVAESAAVDSIQKTLKKSSEVEITLPVFQSTQPDGEDDFIVVTENFTAQFKEGISRSKIQSINTSNNVVVVEEDYLGPNTYILAVTAKSKLDAIDMANKYHQMAETEFAEPEFAFPLTHLAPPVNDPLFSAQWALDNMNVPQAWTVTRGSSAIKIAILDEGVDIYHPDLRQKIVTPYDAVGNDNNQQPNAWDGHGTACAGIAAGSTNNNLGISGVAANCKIMPIRIALSRVKGGGWFTSSTIIARGIRIARLRGADILSNSWGGGPYSTTIRNEFRNAKNLGRGGKGCVVICATGNADREGVIYPAKYPECMACGASNQWDKRKSKTSQDGEYWWGSNYGKEVDFVAPGVHIYTTDNRGSAGYSAGDYVKNFNGTSSATPNAAGVAGLVLSADPNLKEWQVGDILKLTAKDISPNGKDKYTGYGRVDAFRAVRAAKMLCFTPKLQIVFLGKNKECFMRFKYLKLSNCGIAKIRLNTFKINSYDKRGNVIDSFSYKGTPGGIMQPGVSPTGGSGHNQTFSNVLLKAEGTKSKWRYSWRAFWTYTFWRPGASSTDASLGALEELNFSMEIPVGVSGTDVEEHFAEEANSAQQTVQSENQELLVGEYEENDLYADEDNSINGEGGVTISPNSDRSITIKF